MTPLDLDKLKGGPTPAPAPAPAPPPRRAPPADTRPATDVLADVERYVVALEAAPPLFADTHDEWIKVGFALATLGEPGREYFHRVSRLSPKYDEATNDAQFDNALKTGDGSVAIATFFYLCKEAGITPPPRPQRGRPSRRAQREKASSPAQEALAEQGPYYSPELIEGAVGAAFATPPRHAGSGIRDQIGKHLAKKWDFYHDSSTGLNYYRPVGNDDPRALIPFTEKSLFLNNLLIDLERAQFGKREADKKTLIETVFSSYCLQSIDVMAETLRYLAARWDGKDRIGPLLKTIKTDDDELCARMITKWLLNLVAQIHGGSSACRNEHAFVLVSRQGLGKTTFFQHLLWDHQYFASPPAFDFGNKEHNLMLSTKVLILLDEMGQYKKADIATLKAAFSQDKVTADRKYRDTADYRRIASFAGCTNDDAFLKDDTGDRRFWVFRMLELLDFDAYYAVDKAQLWGQLETMYQREEAYLPTPQEEEVMATRNREQFSEEKREHVFMREHLVITGDRNDFVLSGDLETALDYYRHAHHGQGYWNPNVVRQALQQDSRVKCSERIRVQGKQLRAFTGVRLAAPLH